MTKHLGMASGMSLIALKAIFCGLVFICGGVGVLLPWVLGRGDRAERLMAWGDAFAGGVLGGAGLVHLLSGGANEFRALAPALEYPPAFVLGRFPTHSTDRSGDRGGSS